MESVIASTNIKEAKKLNKENQIKKQVDLYVHLDKTIKGLETKKKEIRKLFDKENLFGIIEGNIHAINITKEHYRFFNKKKLEKETGKEFVKHFTEERERVKIIIVK